MRNAVGSDLTVPQVVGNDGVKFKSSICEQDSEEKRPPSTQYSMRRTRTIDDLERDGRLTPLQSSTKESTGAPLNPVTPLRWKSSKRLENEKKKLQEEIKNKDAVKEDVKQSKFVKDIKKEQSNTKVVPKLAVNGMKTSGKAETSTTNHVTSQDEVRRLNTSDSVVPMQAAKTSFNGNHSRQMSVATCKAAGNKQGAINHVNEKSMERKPSPLKTKGDIDEQPTNRKEVTPLNAELGNDHCNTGFSGLDRKSHTGDEPPVITVDFLRARLLAERVSSKAAKEQVEVLNKKMLDLESKLDQEIQLKKKAEELAQESHLKIQSLEERAAAESLKYTKCDTNSLEKSMEPSHTCETAESTLLPGRGKLGSIHDAKNSESLGQESASWIEEKIQVVENCLGDAKHHGCVSSKPSDNPSLTLKIENVNNQVISDSRISMFEQDIDELHTVQRLGGSNSQKVKGDMDRSLPEVTSAIDDTVGYADSGLTRQESRLIVELRLRNMWDQMTKEMAALVEVRNQEIVREELFNWIGKCPSVLQDIPPNKTEDKKVLSDASTGDEKLKDVNAPSTTFGTSTTSKEGENRSLNVVHFSDRSTVQVKGLKKVATMIERFEAQEVITKEWDQNSIQKNLTGRRLSGETSICRTTNSPGISHEREYLQESQPEQSPRTSPQLRDPRYNRHIQASMLSPNHDRREHNLLTEKGDCKVGGFYTQNASPSTYLDSVTVKEVEGQSGGEGINSDRDHRIKNPMLEREQSEMMRPRNPSIITTTLLGASPVTGVGENKSDITNSLVSRSQFLERSDHYNSPRASLEARHESSPGHSGRSNTERVEPSRAGSLAGWEKQEEHHILEMPNSERNCSSEWDVSIVDRHQLHGRSSTSSQAGSSNAYIRPEVLCNYPLRKDEREIYRGRMESVSRSIEGLEGAWVSDPRGYNILPNAHVTDSAGSGTIRSRSGSQTSFQVHGSSAQFIHYQAASLIDKSLSLADYSEEFSRENYHRSPSSKIESTYSKVNDVLKALHLAKLSIQNTEERRPSIFNPSEPRNTGSEKHSYEASYPVDGVVGITNGSSTTPYVWSNEDFSRGYSVGEYSEDGSTR